MTDIAPEKPEMLTIREFCEACRISERQYHRLRAVGQGPDITRLGGRHLIQRTEMSRWIERRTENRFFEIR